MTPVHFTRGSGTPNPAPGWSFLEGGSASARIGPIPVVYLSMVDPEGRVWLEWFAAKEWLPIGIRVLVPFDRRFARPR